jgi:hypothetical protein
MQSISYGDLLLYADFMGDADGPDDDEDDTDDNDVEDSADISSKTILSLVRQIELDNATDDNDGAGDRDTANEAANISQIQGALKYRGFVDLDIVCMDENGQDARIPQVRVYASKQSISHAESTDDSSGATTDNTTKRKGLLGRIRNFFSQ